MSIAHHLDSIYAGRIEFSPSLEPLTVGEREYLIYLREKERRRGHWRKIK